MIKTRLLILASEALLRRLQPTLAELGHQIVATARTGNEGLQLAEQQRPDLVLLDLQAEAPAIEEALAAALQDRLGIPVVYLAESEAHPLLQQARLTNPFAYVLAPFDAHDLNAAITFTHFKQRLERQLRDGNARLQALSETAHHLLLTDRPEKVIPGLLDKLTATFGLDIYLIHLVTEGQQQMRLLAWSGLPDELAARVDYLPVGESFCGRLPSNQVPLIHEHLQSAENRFPEALRELQIKACACYPLMAQEGMIGTLCFASTQRPDFSAEDRELMQTVCAQIAMALDRSRLIATLRGRADELKEIDRRKDDFLAMLAHELRNPLTPILSALEVMRLRGFESPAQKHSMDIVERQAQQMARLLDDLLDVSRIARGKIELRRDTLELTTVIAEVVENILPSINSRKQKFAISLPPESLWLEADPTRLDQILTNLLNNATKYTEMGGNIWLEVERQGQEVDIRVRDSGMGISSENLPRIFDLFAQGDQSPERAQGGLGIGLTMVRNLVEMHHGRVGASSPGIGQGSTFSVHLPLLPEDRWPQHEGAGKGTVGIHRRRRRILIVEDNVDSARSFAELLELWGHEVRIAYDGPMAIELARQYKPEVVLLDIGLPGMNGYQVTHELRQLEDFSSTLIIAVTGFGQTEDQQLAREAGINYHITKPIDFAALEALLV